MRIAGFAMQLHATESGTTGADVEVAGLEHGLCALLQRDRSARGSLQSELAHALYGAPKQGATAVGRVRLALLPGEETNGDQSLWPLALRLRGLSQADMPVLSRWLSYDFSQKHSTEPLELGPSWDLNESWRETSDGTDETRMHQQHRPGCRHQRSIGRGATTQNGIWQLQADKCQQAASALDDYQQSLRQRISDGRPDFDAYRERLASERQCLSSLAARVADIRTGLTTEIHGQCCACQCDDAIGQIQVLAGSLAQRLDSIHALLATQHELSLDRETRAELEELASCRESLENHGRWLAGQQSSRHLPNSHRSTPLDTASRFVQRLTQGEVSAIRRRDASGHAEAVTRSSGRLALEALPADQRDLAVLSLCLAAATLYQETGLRLPLLLGEPMTRFHSQQRHVVADVLREFAGRNAQVIIVTGSEQLALQINGRETAARHRSSDDTRHRAKHESRRVVPTHSPVPPQTKQTVGFVPPVPKSSLLEFTSSIERLAFLEAPAIQSLKQRGIRSIGDLLDHDAETLAREIPGVKASSLRIWQRAGLLACFLPELDAHDGFVLASSGVDDPESLADADGQDLYRRVRSFLRHEANGRRYRGRATRYSRDRLRSWSRSAHSRRVDWTNSRYSRGRSTRSSASSRQSTSNRSRSGSMRTSAGNSNSNRNSNRSREQRTATASQPLLHEPSTVERSERTARESKRREPRRQQRKQQRQQVDSAPRFYLEGSAAVVDAPTIGPKMAERLERIGIRTVSDLLKADPKQLAARLKHRSTTGDTVLEWQRQSRLMCQVPGLRGHDASVLVACQFFTPAAVAAKSPGELLAIVAPFAATKEGKRILRGGQQPDLAEVTDWVNWAQQVLRSEAA